MRSILGQAKLVCQAWLCDLDGAVQSSQTCRVDFQQIADRIDRLIGRLGEDDKKINAAIAKTLHLSGEAVRRWRKGVGMPRLENLEPLCQYLRERDIEASPPYILFGFHHPIKEVHIRERIADEGHELALLRAFRKSSPEGQGRILDTAIALQVAYPLDSKVIRLEARKRRRKR
jgi:hypothetical protein